VPPIVLTTASDRRRRLSDGALVQASVRARVAGIPLLRLDATVALVPAEMTSAPATPREARARAPARLSDGLMIRSSAAGHGLAEAVRNINEGATLLNEVRHNGAR
jgi:hypothetical protein